MTNWNDYTNRIQAASSLEEVESIEQELFGRKQGALTLAMKSLKDLSGEEKKNTAVELNQAKKDLQESLEEKKSSLLASEGSNLKETDSIDVTLQLPQKQYGHLHVIPEFIARIEEVFGRMGFDVAYGPEIETEENNFTKLNIPSHHPARDAHDTFWVESDKTGEEKPVLRTHTSNVQIHYMQTHKPPFRMICPGKTYRKDEDATHSPMFHQFEGLMIGKDVSMANMKAVLISAMRELIDSETEFRFRTSYFPFVEPGAEVDMAWKGDVSASREGKWLEMGGCGMVHPNVLRNVGIDPDEWQGFAFGFGVERPAMIKYQIPDIRMFYKGDLRFLKQF